MSHVAREGEGTVGQRDERWIEVTPSQFTHEAEGLNIIRALLPKNAPFRAWSNLEFRDGQGKWHEVDLMVLGRRRLHLVPTRPGGPQRTQKLDRRPPCPARRPHHR